MSYKRMVGLTLATVSLSLSAMAAANSYPDRPVSLVVAFTAGGSTDIIGREYAKRLADRLGQSVVVENRPGGSGNIGVQHVIRTAADGYTIMMGNMGPLVVNPALNPDLKLDPRTDLTPISPLVAAPNVLVVGADASVNSFEEFRDWAKSQPQGSVTYASTGVGTAAHLSSHVLSTEIGANALHVPYKGAGGLVDIIAGRVDFTMATAPSVLSMIEAGKLKPLLVTGNKRVPVLPEVPAASEFGLDSALVSAWFGVYGPPGLPESITALINNETSALLASQEFIDRLGVLGAIPADPQTPAEYSEYLTSEIERMQGVVADIGVTAK